MNLERKVTERGSCLKEPIDDARMAFQSSRPVIH